MRTEKRVYRTADGDLVREGDPSAAFLAYGAGDDVENRDEKAVTALFAEKPEPELAPAATSTERPDGRAGAEKWLAYAESIGVTVPKAARDDKAFIRGLVEKHEKAAARPDDKKAEKSADKQAAKPDDK